MNDEANSIPPSLSSISGREFDIYAMSLTTGPDFEPFVVFSACKDKNAGTVGAILLEPQTWSFDIIVLRRRVDSCFVLTHRQSGFITPDDALSELTKVMLSKTDPEPIPPGIKARKRIDEISSKGPGEYFRRLCSLDHYAALMVVGELYFAMPCPDDNFVTDLHTNNFNSRLWELYLLACFREQGISVTQPHRSPDFLIERVGHQCYVEAVTANPKDGQSEPFGTRSRQPDDKTESLLGAPAVRFAKTLRSKLQRHYHEQSHVKGHSFVLAISDFHRPGSMVWSREALPAYLYGLKIDVTETSGKKQASASAVTTLAGPDQIPAGLFKDPKMAHLAAVIFSNSATLGEFNRMGYLAGWKTPGLRMTRIGILYDRTPGALESIPFELDILSDEYTKLWPQGEAWCQELEVFHNPLASQPISFDLIPGATHWFESNGEIVCSSPWQWTVLRSLTKLSFDKTG